MDSRFSLKLLVHETGLVSLMLRHWLYLDQIFFKINVICNCMYDNEEENGVIDNVEGGRVLY